MEELRLCRVVRWWRLGSISDRLDEMHQRIGCTTDGWRRKVARVFTFIRMVSVRIETILLTKRKERMRNESQMLHDP